MKHDRKVEEIQVMLVFRRHPYRRDNIKYLCIINKRILNKEKCKSYRNKIIKTKIRNGAFVLCIC